MLPHETRVSLILRVANEQDVLAWQQFVEIYQPLVFRIARSQGLQEADAQDLVQEVMTRVARSIGNWDPDARRGTFRGWISTIARNLIIDFLRHRNRLPKTGDQSEIRKLIEQTPDHSTEALQFDLEFEKQVFAWAAMQVRNQVKEKTWQAFWQSSVEHKPVAAVAAALGLTPGAVYIARCRVMAKLKDVVQSQSAFRE